MADGLTCKKRKLLGHPVRASVDFGSYRVDVPLAVPLVEPVPFAAPEPVAEPLFTVPLVSVEPVPGFKFVLLLPFPGV